MSVAGVFNSAADLIEERGLCKNDRGSGYGPRGEVCPMVAILRTRALESHPAIHILKAHLKTLDRPYMGIVEWASDPKVTQEDVIATLRYLGSELTQGVR